MSCISDATSPNTLPDNHYLKVLDQCKLGQHNFIMWYGALSNVLKEQGWSYVLDKELPTTPPTNDISALEEWIRHQQDSLSVSRLIMDTVNPVLLKDLEILPSRGLLDGVKRAYRKHYNITRVCDMYRFN